MKLEKSIDSWTCKNCGCSLNQNEIKSIKSGVPVSCHCCNHTLAVALYLKKQEQGDSNNDSIVHPVGRLSIRQKVVPLDVEIQKFGDSRSDDSESHDYFAPAAYQKMSDSDKLDAPSFEKICPFCGHKNESGSSVCENCGASI